MVPVPVPPQSWRLAAVMMVFSSLMGWIGTRVHNLQVENGRILTERGERQRERRLVIPARRGEVLATDGEVLATSLGTWDLYADPQYMEDRLTASVHLPAILGIDRQKILAELQKPANGRCLARSLTDEQVERVRALKLAGLHLKRVYRRQNPFGITAAHVLGFLLDNGQGGGGLEGRFNKQMAGCDGYETLAIDALGTPMVGPEAPSQAPQHGASIQLTLVLTLQQTLETALAETGNLHQAVGVYGLVLRPGTGEILAMASWPPFDPNDFRQTDPSVFRNGVIGFAYESGSTIKPLVAGAAVSDRLVNWTTEIDCEHGSWTATEGRHSRTVHSHAHGTLSVSEGVAVSDNIMMAKLAFHHLGTDRLRQWIELFGFGRTTGLELPGEDAGLIPRNWSLLYSAISVSFGHEILITPLQMACAHAAVANGGVWMPPRLIRRIWRPNPNDGHDEDLPLPTHPAPRRIFNPEIAAGITDSMRKVITEGTGKKLALPGYSFAGKTGTTEKQVGGHYVKDRNIGSFVGWAPAKPGCTPEVLVMVVVDEPRRNGHFGAETAGPAVQRMMTASLSYLKVPPDQPEDPAPATPVRRRGTIR